MAAMSAILLYCIQCLVGIDGLKRNFTFSLLPNEDTFTSMGSWIAIKEINNDSTLLPNHTLKFRSFDTHRNVQDTLRKTLQIVRQESSVNDIHCPIIVGPPWSSLAVTSAPVLNTFGMGLISESASSIALSDSNEYPYVYRFVHKIYMTLFTNYHSHINHIQKTYVLHCI